MPGFLRAALFCGIFLSSLVTASAPSAAGPYPDRPVHWLIGFAAGGPVDIVARIMSQWLSDKFGQQFIVENRAGSGGNIAAAAAVNATPDGYTILFDAPNNAISTSLYKHLSYDFPARHGAGRQHHATHQHDGGDELAAGQDHPGVHRPLQSQSRQDLLRF